MGNLKEIDIDNTNNVCAVCNSAAPHICSACKSIAYCSKDHQKQHWKEHKSACVCYEVKVNNELGRYLIACRDISDNDVIVTDQPLVLGPKLFDPSPVCLGCYRPPTPGVRCPRCFWPVCQLQCPGLQDPHHHSIECFVLSLGKAIALQPGGLRYEIITPLRCLLLQKRNQKRWHKVISMEAHTDSRGPNSDVYKELDETVVSYLIDNYLIKLEEGLNYSKEVLHKICGVLDVNALEICSGGNIQLLALYQTICLMEHKCLPNTKYYYNPEYKIILSPNTRIKKGDHLSTSYTHVLWGTQERREHLKQNKYFACQCERCSDPTEFGTYLSALRCHGLEQNGACDGYQLPEFSLDEESEWKCNKCPVSLTSDEVKNLISILTTETDSLIKQSKPLVGHVRDLLNKLQYFLHSHHYLCYETKHLLIQLYGHQAGYLHKELSTEQLQEKEGICRDLLSINKKLDPGNYRLSLYSTVLMYELHSAILELAERNVVPPTTAKEEAKSLLTDITNILEHELVNTPGSDMRLLAKKSNHELEMRSNK